MFLPPALYLPCQSLGTEQKTSSLAKDAAHPLYSLYLRALAVAVGLSMLSYLHFLFRASTDSPLLRIFPRSTPDPPLPFARAFINLADLSVSAPPYVLAPTFAFLFGFTLPAPALSLLCGHSWQTTTWWMVAPTMVGLVRIVESAIASGDDSIAQLERLKYKAPGA
ncbi:hypothetical protein BD626DRAFT_568622 [Schizophyllum amplum]|uniref:Uncharacterized protein n=1 Tax=Schizophyllum amplum TaxID=97359 RepID=A0A550CGT8_9AGAR|nr:hypothetical protein BD626DRAFT_568622 [Auriculariopsis ampla]